MNSLIHRGGFLEDFFRDMSPGFYVKPLHGDGVPAPAQIKIDVREDDRAYTVLSDIPGVAKEDIHVSLDGNVVTLQAEIKQHDSQEREHKVLRSERYYGAVSRSFQLPMEIDQALASARYDNGVLVLTLPKKLGQGAQRLRID